MRDFPDPFSPIMTNVVPFSTPKDRSANRFFFPIVFPTDLNVIDASNYFVESIPWFWVLGAGGWVLETRFWEILFEFLWTFIMQIFMNRLELTTLCSILNGLNKQI